MPEKAQRRAGRHGRYKSSRQREQTSSSSSDEPIVVAVPKGRVLEELAPRLEEAGLDAEAVLADDRRLIRQDANHGVRFLLLKPDDVPTYVEYGAADLGVVGRDVLLERDYDLYAPVDLGIGRCRMAVAAPRGAELRHASGRTLRVATKFPNIASRHFLSRGQPVEVIYVQGSVELGPLTGLADVIVDLVQSGKTLEDNGLEELETICDVSSVVVGNRVGLKLKRQRIAPLLKAFRGSVE